ncbi:MAG: hypothetical protein AAGI34_13765 [Pseudomonadota bacterium]
MPDTTSTHDPKPRLVQIAEHHLAADMLVQGGDWFRGGRGCSIGCFLKDLDQPGSLPRTTAFQDAARLIYLDVDAEWAARLHLGLFERLPAERARQFHVEVARALTAGGDGSQPDMQRVYHRTMIAVLDVALRHAGETAAAVSGFRSLHERILSGQSVSEEEWVAARGAFGATSPNAAVAAAWAAVGDVSGFSVWVATEVADFCEIASAFIAALRTEALAKAHATT